MQYSGFFSPYIHERQMMCYFSIGHNVALGAKEHNFMNLLFESTEKKKKKSKHLHNRSDLWRFFVCMCMPVFCIQENSSMILSPFNNLRLWFIERYHIHISISIQPSIWWDVPDHLCTIERKRSHALFLIRSVSSIIYFQTERTLIQCDSRFL